MKYLFLNKRIFCILLFCFSILSAQKITIINKINEPIIIKNDKIKTVINDNSKIELSETNTISINGKTGDLNRTIILFLEPMEKLTISLEKNNKIVYTGDQAGLHEYINEKLNIDTFGKMNSYDQIGGKRNAGELKNVSELLLMDVLKKANLSDIVVYPEDKASTKKLKNYIKYNWLYTLFFTINQQDKNFKKKILNDYYKKYIETDIKKYHCNNSLQYNVIEILAKNKNLLQIDIPTYPIVEHTKDDSTNQYLPQSCQKQYFTAKYKYLEHINGHNKEYYKKVLIEKFNGE